MHVACPERPNDIFSDEEPDYLELRFAAIMFLDGTGNRSLQVGEFLNVFLQGSPCQLLARLALRNDYRLFIFCESSICLLKGSAPFRSIRS